MVRRTTLTTILLAAVLAALLPWSLNGSSPSADGPTVEWGAEDVTLIGVSATIQGAGPTSSNYGSAADWSATVGGLKEPCDGDGSFAFKDGLTTLGDPHTFATAGQRTITVEYTGDAGGSQCDDSTTFQHTVNKGTPSVGAVQSNTNPSNPGQSVTFSTTVSGGGPTPPSGTVEFREGATVVASGSIGAGGVASGSTSALAIGTHTITAHYLGDSNYNAASSAAGVNQTVQPGVTTVTVTDTPDPSAVGQAVTLEATVTGNNPTGTVQFKDGGTDIGAPATLTAGTATIQHAFTTGGVHEITAAYSGDGNNQSATSTAVQHTVSSATTTSISSSFNPSPGGAEVQFTMTVAPAVQGAGTPTGTVKLWKPSINFVLCEACPLTNGVATYSTSSLGVGSHSLQAVYTPDSAAQANAFTGSTSSTFVQEVSANATAISIRQNGPSNAGTPTNFILTLVGPQSFGQSVLRGTATVRVNGQTVGTVTSWTGDPNPAKAQVTAPFAHTFTTNGPHTVDVVFQPDNTSAQPATSQPITVNVGGPGGGGGTDPTQDPDPVFKELKRIGGTDRIDTAIQISLNQFPTAGSAGGVVLARSDLFFDALAGTPLAIKVNGPLLLTTPKALDPRVEAEIKRVLAAGKTVYLLGGAGALDPAIEDRVKFLVGAGAVKRLNGNDRYETSTVIADQGLANPTTVFLATGVTVADALSVGPTVGKLTGSILLTEGGRMPTAVAAYLTTHAPTTKYAIGGPAARADPTATAIVGTDRYDTAVKVAQQLYPNPTKIGVANGNSSVDALGGGTHIGLRGGPMVLVTQTGMPIATDTYLKSVAASVTEGFVYGGRVAVVANVARQVDTAIAPA